MAKLPVITSPCPLRMSTKPGAGRDQCSLCKRRVHDLDAMTDAQRESFIANCSGEVCVVYTVRRPIATPVRLRSGIAAAAVLGVASAAWAVKPTGHDVVHLGPKDTAQIADLAQSPVPPREETVMLAGGIRPMPQMVEPEQVLVTDVATTEEVQWEETPPQDPPPQQ